MSRHDVAGISVAFFRECQQHVLLRTGADYYPFFEFPSGSNLSTSIAGYRAALGVLRSASLRANVPFWNVRHVTLPRFDRACRLANT